MVGFFDSGVGGLSILREVKKLLPNLSTLYLADSANFPYGNKTEEEVKKFTLSSIRLLMDEQPEAVVVACNSASTTALQELRKEFPETPIVGVVPAIKPAAILTKTGKIAVLATERTIQSKAYQDLKHRFAGATKVTDQPCPGWVELVESGQLDDQTARNEVQKIIEPLAQEGNDVFVLGCTHYPFLRPLIETYAGAAARVIDSGPAVAQQLQLVLGKNLPLDNSSRYLCTGDAAEFSRAASLALGQQITAEHINLDA